MPECLLSHLFNSRMQIISVNPIPTDRLTICDHLTPANMSMIGENDDDLKKISSSTDASKEP
ncbi:Zinc finger CCCH-type antiviral 1 [Gossypium arboreum]|uniref:Zinc finger CCCH-type antiviral 1 n=1 Tax=Gossypium arboreum TaxID=29729 RepID=A0A0B0PD72_GOSAR|nr:Zinc finger CCCH-type antiviral 1 [Gossypium arboreum]